MSNIKVDGSENAGWSLCGAEWTKWHELNGVVGGQAVSWFRCMKYDYGWGESN